MKKIILSVILSVIATSLAFAFFPIAIVPNGGVYNPVSGWMSCKDETSCLFVVGERVDTLHGNMSQSDEFHRAINDYVSQNLQDKWSIKINSVFKNGDIENGNTWKSLYAFMYVWYRTDETFPDSLGRYFNPIVKPMKFYYL